MTPVFERYAEAMYKSAQSLKCVDVVAEEMLDAEDALSQCVSYLNSPLIGAGDKAALLRELLEGKVSPLLLEFILLMTTRRHIRHYHSVVERFRRLSGHGKVVVRLRVPFEPDQNLIGRLKMRFVKEKLIPTDMADKKFDINIVVDNGLIGGFIASCEGYQIDTSLKTALTKLKRPS
jgi:F-type H+-transporting ATPase subunit delta